MRLFQKIRVGLVCALALVGGLVSQSAHADAGRVRITMVKAGWFIGGAGGTGTLTFHGRSYRLSVGGLSAGLVFGASGTNFVGTVSNISSPSDIEGVYGAAGAGVAFAVGAGTIVLTNDKGAILRLNGQQVGLIANLDLSGMAISLQH